MLILAAKDACLDVDEAALSAASCTLGNQVFVLNAKTGDVIGKFDTEAPVVGEVSPSILITMALSILYMRPMPPAVCTA